MLGVENSDACPEIGRGFSEAGRCARAWKTIERNGLCARQTWMVLPIRPTKEGGGEEGGGGSARPFRTLSPDDAGSGYVCRAALQKEGGCFRKERERCPFRERRDSGRA